MAQNVTLANWIAQIPVLFFVFAVGACVGSFINVLAYRLPKGLGVIVPASRCPKCQRKLTWRENFPILGWLWLRGRCRFCKERISIEYPIIEFLVALLFASLYMLWCMQPSPLVLFGLPSDWLRPDWAGAGLQFTWPAFTVMLALVGALVAMTVIDARTFTIPVSIPWFLLCYGLLVHTAHALWIGSTRMGRLPGTPHDWVIPVGTGQVAWPFAIGAVGGGVGLLVSIALMRVGALPQSFADYEDWEKSVTPPTPDAAPESAPNSTGSAPGSLVLRVLLFTGPIIALMFLGSAVGQRSGRWGLGMLIGGATGAVVGVLLRRLAPDDGPRPGEPIWTQYPHARREMFKEIAFLFPPALGLVAGWLVGESIAGSQGAPASDPALWLKVFAGSLMGILIGGGVVWIVRILGTLAFGREAIGLGDVHMMAGIGAALGWIDPVLAFFIAPFSGIAWAVGSALFARFGKAPRILPYGPHLALATLVIVYARPAIEILLSAVAGQPVNLP